MKSYLIKLFELSGLAKQFKHDFFLLESTDQHLVRQKNCGVFFFKGRRHMNALFRPSF